MRKNLIFITFGLLLFACSKSDQDYVELCANQKTSTYWNQRANQFIEEKNRWVLQLTRAKDKYEKESIRLMINSKDYYIDLYTNASKKKLDEKMYEFPSFANNFKNCGKEFKDNPVYFKQRYN
jgi:predicted membrane protein